MKNECFNCGEPVITEEFEPGGEYKGHQYCYKCLYETRCAGCEAEIAPDKEYCERCELEMYEANRHEDYLDDVREMQSYRNGW